MKTQKRRHLFLAIVIGSSALCTAFGDVQYADPKDPVFRALYPKIDTSTGITLVAEPEIASGRIAPRQPGTNDCQAGFRIAEPRTKEWRNPGGIFTLAAFLVTTDNKPGVPAPCYHPEPWVCALEKKEDGTLLPVDCLKVDPTVFPEDLSLDTAHFNLSQTERAFGVRIRNELDHRWGTETDTALLLFRLQNRRLSQILAVRMSYELDDFGQGNACARELVLTVEKTQTQGFFDWSIHVGKEHGPGRCEIPENPEGTYRWDGTRYIKAGRGFKADTRAQTIIPTISELNF